MNTKQSLYLALAATFTVTFAISMLQTMGIMPTAIVSGSMVGGMVGWYFTSLKYPTDPRKILPIYLLTMPLLYLHIGEEYLYQFGPRIGAITGTGWTESEFLIQFAFYLPIFWIVGAIGLYYRHLLANFLSWFVFFGMFLGEPTHLLVFPNLEGGRYHYFPGMWTALLPMVMGVWGIYIVMQEHKKINVTCRFRQVLFFVFESKTVVLARGRHRKMGYINPRIRILERRLYELLSACVIPAAACRYGCSRLSPPAHT